MAANAEQLLVLIVLVVAFVGLVSGDFCNDVKIPYLNNTHKKEMKVLCGLCCQDFHLKWSYNKITRQCHCNSDRVARKYYTPEDEERREERQTKTLLLLALGAAVVA